MIDPGGMLGEMIKEIAVNNQQPAAVDGFVNEHVGQLDTTEGLGSKGPQELVMVAGGVVDPRAPLEHAKNSPDHKTGSIVPVERSLQFPAVDNVAD